MTTAQSEAHHIETILHNYKETVELLAVGIPITNVFDPQIDYTKRMTECNLRIKRTIETNPAISRIRILNKNGIVIASSHEDIGFDQSNKAIFIAGRDSAYICCIHKSEYTGTLVLGVSVPIYVRDIFSGVLIINFDLEKQLYKILTNRAGLGETGEVFLVNSDAYLISPSRFIDDAIFKIKLNSEQVNLYISEHPEKRLTENMEEKPTEYIDYRGEKVLGTHYYIPEMQWGLIAEIDVAEVYKPINKQTVFLITILSVLLIIILLIVVMITKNISHPIRKLTNGAERIIKGNFDYKIGIESKDEIGMLSRTFDIMSHKLNKSHKELEEYAEDLETTIKKRTSELEKQFEKSEKQRIAGLVILNDLNKTTTELKAEITERSRAEQIQKVLYNISNAVSITDNLKKLIGLIQKELGTIIDTTNFFVALHDHKTDMLTLPFYADEKDKYTSIPARKTLTRYVIDTEKPLLANIALKKKLVKEGKLDHVGSLSKIWLGVPLKIEEKVTGVLAVQSYTDE
ncbi:MAG: HAMP domain-containing protein, partial [Bacteroidales bacterium]|nr:HAMP domain-containing protein [Bacteroidales bacterium]